MQKAFIVYQWYSATHTLTHIHKHNYQNYTHIYRERESAKARNKHVLKCQKKV